MSSIVCQSKSVILLDSETSVRRTYSKDVLSLTYNQYCIYNQYIKEHTSGNLKKRMKNGKRKIEDEDADVISIMKAALNEVLNTSGGKDFFSNGKCEKESGEVNSAAHESAKLLGNLDRYNLADKSYDLAANNGESGVPFGFHSRISNVSDAWQFTIVDGQRYIIPPWSSFVMSDLKMVNSSLNTTYDYRFDLVVLDPPWVNKSVKRQKRYYCLDNYDLLNLPIRTLTSNQGLVAIWCTNSPRHQEFLEDTLLPAWNLRQVAKWYWLKVTRRGLPILPFEYYHRRPYEVLYLAAGHSLDVHPPECLVLISIPSSVHSKKPFLENILKDYLKPVNASSRPKCLELFARELHEGWDSWGNEPIRFQHSSLFSFAKEDDIPVISAIT